MGRRGARTEQRRSEREAAVLWLLEGPGPHFVLDLTKRLPNRDASMIYPTLDALERRGLVTSEWVGSRMAYSLVQH